jgi:hypothetical protein
LEQTVTQSQQDALACPVGPHDHGSLSRFERQRYAGDDAAAADREDHVIEPQRKQ